MNTWAWGVPPGMLAGGPGSREYIIVVIALWKEYHCCTFRGSIERRRVPQVRFLNLGLGVDILFLGLATAALLRISQQPIQALHQARRSRAQSTHSPPSALANFFTRS